MPKELVKKTIVCRRLPRARLCGMKENTIKSHKKERGLW